MDRSFRTTELRGRTMGTLMKEKEEELALFMEMRKRDKERNNLLLQNSDELDQPLESHAWGSPTFKIIPTAVKKASMDDFLSTDSEKNDYDWLLTPPGTPLFPSLEKDSHRSPVTYLPAPKAHPTLLRSRLAIPSDPPSGSTNASRMRRPSSSSGDSGVTPCRPITPNGRPVAPTTASKPSRSSTPTARPTFPSKSSATLPRSSTPSRSSAPTARSSAPPFSKPITARSATPTRRPSTPTTFPSSSSSAAAATVNVRSAPIISNTRSVPTASRTASALSSRGTSPTVKSRPWKPTEMPGFSHDAPPNLRTSLPDRPSSASRGRPGAPSSRSSSVENVPAARPRRQSCSPSRGRVPNGNAAVSGGSVPAFSRSRTNGNDNESPVVIGTKMVERVVSLRRLAPPKHDEHRPGENSSGKSTVSPESTGFGRTLSKKSLDMAIRHMDIRRSIPSNLRPLMTNVPASSIYSVRSGSTKSRGAVSMSDSPLATSSNASSESVSNNNAFCLDAGELLGDFFGGAKAGKSSPSFR